MKTSKSLFTIAIACTFLMTSCRETPSEKEESIEEHGHSHDGDEHGHEHDETIEQEEFNVDSTATEIIEEADTHTHDDGQEHHNH